MNREKTELEKIIKESEAFENMLLFIGCFSLVVGLLVIVLGSL